MAGVPRTRYARSGELNIAYQVLGDGPMALVSIPGFVSHLDLAWEDPHRAEAARRWATFAKVVLFDKRNTGLSDRTAGPPTMEERMDDIRAVMDDAGIERAALVGVSEGGPLALLFAATYPERVDALALLATYGRIDPPDDFEERLQGLHDTWGTGFPMQYFDPSCDLEWAARFERSSATPRIATEILRLNLALDATPALPAISAPTLLIHRRGDPIIPLAAAQELVQGIDGAHLVVLDGDSHLPGTSDEWAEQLDLIEEFLTGATVASEPDRVLATVLFTDIVDSTATAVALGDREWRQRLGKLQDQTDRLVRQFGGRRVKTTGDGILATFDGPARAIRCARTLTERATASGLPIRAGLHTGEVELVGDDIAGIAVHLAKRVESAAAAGTVYVSQTVRDLIAGSPIALTPRGTHELKGVPGSWDLFEVESV
jgi:class 3 adenylate cyclase